MEDGIVYYKKDLDIFVYLEPVTVDIDNWYEKYQNILAIGRIISEKESIVEIYAFGNAEKEENMVSYVKDKYTNDYLLIRPYVDRSIRDDYKV